jgi:hypothetical protein
MSLNLGHRNKKLMIFTSPEGELEWIPDDKLLDLNLWENDHIFFPRLKEGKYFSAKFEYDGDVMKRYEVTFPTSEV